METVRFQFEQCEHVERLQNILIIKYLNSIRQYYFDFLRKLKLGFDLPPDRVCLMKTIYASGTRYSKEKSANANYLKEEIVSDDNEAEEIAHREADVPKIRKTYKRKALDRKSLHLKKTRSITECYVSSKIWIIDYSSYSLYIRSSFIRVTRFSYLIRSYLYCFIL